MDKYLEILQHYWGYSSFRPAQEKIIRSVMEGKDTLGLMPTGGGKSITFQVPAVAMNGVCLIISPLIALMNDQVERLKKAGIKACAIHSGLSFHEIGILLDNAVYGAYKLLYISPERITTEIFTLKVQNMPVSLLVVDEAHCISQWGYDFRPSYLEISKIRRMFPKVPVLALTATATPDVAHDIQEKLGFKENNVIVSEFTRENLVYFVRHSDSKMNDIVRVVKSIKGSGIIYARSRNKTKETSDHLNRSGINADYYHAGMNYENRCYKQDRWSKGQVRIIVATSAFGMGIDKPDVRFVLHIDMPDSLEAYFQEAGRAGRDGKKAFAVLLVSNTDKTFADKRLNTAFPPVEEIKRIYSAMANYLQVPLGGGKGMVYDLNLFDFAAAYKLNTSVTFSALKTLEKCGYIELTDELNNPSRIIFLLSRDDLYKFQIENRNFDGFIKLLLRSYSGVFSNYAVIDEETLSKRANISRDLVYQYLLKLGKMKVINYIPSKRTPLLFFLEERLDEKSLQISYESYSERKNRYMKRLNSMLDYAFENTECRNQIFLRYFGQTISKPCGQCDVCKKNTRDLVNETSPEQMAAEILRLIRKEPLSPDDLLSQLGAGEEAIKRSIKYLLETEQIMYLADGRINLSM